MKKEKPIYISLGLLIALLFSFEIEFSKEQCAKPKISNIEGIIVHTSANIYLTDDIEESLKIEGEQEVIDRLIVKEEGNNIIVELKDSFNPVKFIVGLFKKEPTLNIFISGPRANEIELVNEKSFNICSFYENQESKVLEVKNPSLFTFYKEMNCKKTSLSVVILKHLQFLT